MLTRILEKFFGKPNQKSFDDRTDHEIYNRIWAQLREEANCGYPFTSMEEMDALTQKLDIQPLLDTIEEDARNMPESYGKTFRYLMHRDLHKRLLMYKRLAGRRVSRTCDSRFVAVHA